MALSAVETQLGRHPSHPDRIWVDGCMISHHQFSWQCLHQRRRHRGSRCGWGGGPWPLHKYNLDWFCVRYGLWGWWVWRPWWVIWRNWTLICTFSIHWQGCIVVWEIYGVKIAKSSLVSVHQTWYIPPCSWFLWHEKVKIFIDWIIVSCCQVGEKVLPQAICAEFIWVTSGHEALEVWNELAVQVWRGLSYDVSHITVSCFVVSTKVTQHD